MNASTRFYPPTRDATTFDLVHPCELDTAACHSYYLPVLPPLYPAAAWHIIDFLKTSIASFLLRFLQAAVNTSIDALWTFLRVRDRNNPLSTAS